MTTAVRTRLVLQKEICFQSYCKENGVGAERLDAVSGRTLSVEQHQAHIEVQVGRHSSKAVCDHHFSSLRD